MMTDSVLRVYFCCWKVEGTGTGIVASNSNLAHKEPHRRLLGISVPKYTQMNCPIDLIHSCREGDVSFLQEIKQYCLDLDGNGNAPHPKFRGLRNYTLLVTPDSHNNGLQPPFPTS